MTNYLLEAIEAHEKATLATFKTKFNFTPNGTSHLELTIHMDTQTPQHDFLQAEIMQTVMTMVNNSQDEIWESVRESLERQQRQAKEHLEVDRK